MNTKVQIKKLAEELIATNREEKHIGYHIPPLRMREQLEEEFFEANFNHVFYENERLEYFKKWVDFDNKSVLDIGCNIGYFLFSFLDEGAKSVKGYEGKVSCGNFIRKAIKIFSEHDKFEFENNYYDFSELESKYDVVLLLNVLHHLGDDYGDIAVDMQSAKSKMLAQLNQLSQNTNTLIFQMGFNWKGDRNKCLFENGTKSEMIDFIREGICEHWSIKAIGIPERVASGIVYEELNDNNIKRQDELGEFLNRPIFILESKKISL